MTEPTSLLNQRVLRLAVIFASLFISRAGLALIQFVHFQETSQALNNNSIQSGAFYATSGNLLVCKFGYTSSTQSVSTVTDTASNVYYRAIGPVVGVGDMFNSTHEIWYAYNITGSGSLNVTATFTGTFNATKEISCHEYSGAVTSSDPKDVAISATGTSGIPTVGPFTTSQDGELIFSFGSFVTGPTTGNGFIERSIQGGDQTQDRIAWSAGSYSAAYTGAASGWMHSVVTFKSAVVPTSTNGLVQRSMTHQPLVGNSVTTAFDSNNTGGNLIVVMAYFWTNSQTLTVTDTRGNTYQLASTVSQTSDGHQIWLYYAENIAGGANTVTASVTGSPAGYAGFVIAEYSGIVTSGALDKTKTAIGSGISLSTGSTATTSFSDELLVGYFGMSEGGSGFSPTS